MLPVALSLRDRKAEEQEIPERGISVVSQTPFGIPVAERQGDEEKHPMSSMSRCIGTAIAALLWFTFTSNLSFAQENIPGWHSNLEQARRIAEETGKPLFIVFRCVR